ncbi:MAG: FmdB family zinc ribbon protein [Anaerolineales bacterium]
MPIYEYSCPECTHEFSARRSMSDADAPIACPQCGREGPRRGLSLFATVGATTSRGRSGGTTSGGCGSCAGGSCSSCGH